MFENKKIYKTTLAGKELIVEIGELARQANASVLIRYGDTVVLTTAVASKEAKDVDFFPLTVNYEEKMYSVGKIPGGFLRREGRAGTEATLAARLIDRPIRPLFEDGFRNEVQVVSTVLSVEYDCDPVMAAMLGSSLSLSISNIPFKSSIAGVTVGYIDGQYIINPTVDELEKSLIDLKVAGTKYAINMVEAGSKEVSEEVMLNAIIFGHEEIKRLISFQEEIVSEIGQKKMEVTLKVLDEEIYNEVYNKVIEKMKFAISIKDKQSRDEAISLVKNEVIEYYETLELEDLEKTIKEVKDSLDKIIKNEVRREITEDKVRPDGRELTEIRPLSSRIDILPRTHGSAIFTRGQTQSLGVVTLGNISDEQIIDDLTQEENKRFMLHYNFPSFSVGEIGFSRAPGRREIGHGALGERALEQVIPSKEEFPYTIRVVSEILESNGSSSQATICSGSMALMAAGVPIKSQVAGIAMGLIKKDENYTILTDIQGMEDHLGDMDFKVAGTENGITALQMDIKIDGLSEQILKESLEQARIGRLEILNHMNSIISSPRLEVSEYAPKIKIIKIKPDKIKDVIGSGGKTINEIIDKTGVKIDIEQNGDVFISSQNISDINHAVEIIENIVREAEVGEVYLATVRRIEKFGAFVELFPGTDALVHISKLSDKRVEKVENVVKIGDTIKVKVTKIDEKGRVDATSNFE
ncbi:MULTISPECIES: polyribonucleotide nucleotidyltransferase [unclassified Gemella]|uniref:polyribonucleotide nucleotidyltransferase n=1 Tax=unclassified Gemella TaxID=2624949 RepID=UPI001C05730E|nr:MULTISPECIES: polyribonucleotide nucleotidyltransferase [unclassified Gemella]MBU0278307.1 polyribonucleotide nucleotidyltransferase [Gemella sp. zg-1178]QWQ38188.1 polyribonucleotide nucleotidyltransferase [Gemella sp. zg-570]